MRRQKTKKTETTLLFNVNLQHKSQNAVQYSNDVDQNLGQPIPQREAGMLERYQLWWMRWNCARTTCIIYMIGAKERKSVVDREGTNTHEISDKSNRAGLTWRRIIDSSTMVWDTTVHRRDPVKILLAKDPLRDRTIDSSSTKTSAVRGDTTEYQTKRR